MWTNGKPKTDFALTLFCCGLRYLPGANEIINSLDYYGNKIDLHFIHANCPDWWIKRIQAADLNYRIEMIELEEMICSMPKEFQEWEFIRANDRPVVLGFVYYPYTLRDRYKVTGIIQADTLLTDDLTPWFKMTEGSGLLLTAWHSFHGTFLENYDPEVSPTVFPLWPSPWLWEPGKWTDVVEYIFEKIVKECPQFHEMRALGYALHYLKKKDRVVVLNDIEWVERHFWSYPIRHIDMWDGKKYLLSLAENLRIKMFHGCWYSRGFIKGQTENGEQQECRRSMLRQNGEEVFNMYRFFNETLKVRIRPNIEDVEYMVGGPPD